MKLKIITGFREDQCYTIDAEEAHKAYYLFLNPDMRGVFKNGVALTGKNIQGIEPDYHSTMGWNSTHKLDGDDFNEMKSKGILHKFTELLSDAKEVAELSNTKPEIMKLTFSDARKEIEKVKIGGLSNVTKLLADKMKFI